MENMDKEINNNPSNEENINTNIYFSTLNQQFEDTKKQKSSINNIKNSLNFQNDINNDIKEIVIDSKLNSSQKRSNSASNRKLIPEKFELAKFNIPGIENWNCDPTAKIIIHCLEQKIDALMYENHLLKRKIKGFLNNNKDYKFDLSQKYFLLKKEKQINEEIIEKVKSDNKINFKHKKMLQFSDSID